MPEIKAEAQEIQPQAKPEGNAVVRKPLARKNKGREYKGVIKDLNSALDQQKAVTDVERQRAEVDKLTGLPNDKALGKIVNHFVEEGMRYKNDFAVIKADLSGFKWTNDSLGDAQGDIVLQDTAKIFQGNTRRGIDYVVRPHGDTFFVFLAHVSKEEDIKSFFNKINPQFVNGNPDLEAQGDIAISMGALIVTPDNLPTPASLRGGSVLSQEQMLQGIEKQIELQADMALQKAKPLHTRGLPPDTSKNSIVVTRWE